MFRRFGKDISLGFMRATWASVCLPFTWIWSPVYFSRKHVPHRVSTRPRRYSPPKHGGFVHQTLVFLRGRCLWEDTLLTSCAGSYGCPSPPYSLLKCPGSSPWELIFHTVFDMYLSRMVCQGFKGETIKRARIASQVPRQQGQGGSYKLHSFCILKLEETSLESLNFTSNS